MLNRYGELRKQLAHIGPVCNGTVMSVYRKCGKPNCGCKESEQMQHGPYHIWTRKENGKTVTRSLSEKQARLCSRYIENFKKMESVIEKMKKLTIQVIERQK
ncbi:MAG: hypothetical protein JXB06_07935 [Spirochaetales bacterium]|nr:hypothetical protein [Spirochaetales bacterium]